MLVKFEGLKGFINNNFGVAKKKRKMTTDELQQLYQDNISQHKKIKNKAEYVEIKLLVASQIFKELTSNESFSKIVNDEGLQDVVKVIVKNTAN